MQQKPIDILHIIAIAVGFMQEERPELFTENHPLVQVCEAVESSIMFPELNERLKNYTTVETMDLLQDLILACLKQSETYH